MERSMQDQWASLFDEYGSIMIEECQNNAKTYFQAAHKGDIKTSRKAQLSQ